MNHDLPLGRHVDYPREYDASLLFPIARTLGREHIGIGTGSQPFEGLPFEGMDRWNAYELSWLDGRGKPHAGTATITVPATSPNLIESKSLKLYLNSFNATRFASDEEVRSRIVEDLTRVAGATVEVEFGLPPIDETAPGNAVMDCIDSLEIDVDDYGPPNAEHLAADASQVVTEVLTSSLLKSNCPVTGQPDWARIVIAYHGPKLDRAGLLRYLVSFRDHAEFHEQCVERVFVDLLARTGAQRLSVEARYTRRGGLDINPWRATPGSARPVPGRDERQ
jgi:7-cyano-7-deazaguanine reductase